MLLCLACCGQADKLQHCQTLQHLEASCDDGDMLCVQRTDTATSPVRCAADLAIRPLSQELQALNARVVRAGDVVTRQLPAHGLDAICTLHTAPAPAERNAQHDISSSSAVSVCDKNAQLVALFVPADTYLCSHTPSMFILDAGIQAVQCRSAAGTVLYQLFTCAAQTCNNSGVFRAAVCGANAGSSVAPMLTQRTALLVITGRRQCA